MDGTLADVAVEGSGTGTLAAHEVAIDDLRAFHAEIDAVSGRRTGRGRGADLGRAVRLGKIAVRVASVAAPGGLLFGYDSAVITGAVDSIQDSIQEDFGIGNAEPGFAVASALLAPLPGR